MRLYHGTTLENAEHIKRTGLQVQPHKSFRLRIPNGEELRDRETPGIYVTSDPLTAERFAEFRTQYERAPYGAYIAWTAFSHQCKLSHSQEPLDNDPQAGHSFNAYISEQPIPAKYVTAVQEIPTHTMEEWLNVESHLVG